MNPQTCCKLWTARERFFPKRFLPVHIDTNMHLRKFWKNTTEYLRVLLVQLYWTHNSQYLVYMYIYIHFYRLPLPARVRQLPLPLPPPLTASKPVTCSPSTAASAHAAANRLATHVFILCFLSETTWFGACCSWTFALSSDNFFSMQVLHEPGRWCLILFPCDLENRISGSVSLHLEQSNNSGEVADPKHLLSLHLQKLALLAALTAHIPYMWQTYLQTQRPSEFAPLKNARPTAVFFDTLDTRNRQQMLPNLYILRSGTPLQYAMSRK